MRLSALILLTACGGASYDGGVFEEGNVRFRVAEPGSTWSRAEVHGATDLAWTHPELGAMMHVSGSCDPRLDIPLPALTNHLLIGFTEREIVDQVLVPMQGREALSTHARAKLDGVERELRLLVLKKNECVYDFALVARPGNSFAQASSEFERLVDSFEAS